MIHLALMSLFTLGMGTAFGVEIIEKKKKQAKKQAELAKAKDSDQAITCAKVSQLEQKQIEQQEDADEINQYTKLATLGVAFNALGIWYKPFTFPGIALLGYTDSRLLKDAAQGLQQGKLKLSVLDSVAILTGLAGKQYLLSSLASLIYFISMKMRLRSRNHSNERLKHIFFEQQPSVWMLKDGVEISVALSKIQVGDQLVFHAGETLSIDGEIIEGTATLDQRILTGEEQPEVKSQGDLVYAATTLIAGRIVVTVKQSGDSTLAANIGQVLAETDDYIAELETQGEYIANRTVLPTIALAGLTLVAKGPNTMFIVLSSNFAEVMRLTTPLSMLNFLHLASKNGLLIKDGRSLEQLLKVDTVIFDKTGTLTLERPHVGRIYPSQGYVEEDVLFYAAAAEYRQSHPIAQAILSAAKQQGLESPNTDQPEYEMGYGMRVRLEGKPLLVGSRRFLIEQAIAIPDGFELIEQSAHEQGYSLIYVALEHSFLGAIELHPTVRAEALQVVQALQQRGMTVYILSGDHVEPVSNLAQQLGVDGFFAETLPNDKAKIIQGMQDAGKHVCFIGDGLNDAIALKTATVSISLQDASQLAIDSAQIIFLQQDLRQLLDAFDLAVKHGHNQRLGVAASVVIPSVMSAGGAIFFGCGIASALTLYTAGAVLGIGTSTLPVLLDTHKTHVPIINPPLTEKPIEMAYDKKTQ